MKRLLCLLLVCSTGSVLTNGNGELVLRTQVVPDTAFTGQRALLRVDILGLDGWARITRMEPVEIPGAFVLQTESQGVRIQETIGGASYTGQRYALSIFARNSGEVHIPPIKVDASIRSWGGGEKRIEAVTPAATFTAKHPPATEGIKDLITTSRLTASQDWSASGREFMAGDSISRTIEFKAIDVPGMLFRPVACPEIAGIRSYPGEPVVEDKTERGTLSGKRSETISYVFEDAGSYELPAIEIHWWDLEGQVLRREELPGLRVTVNPAPGLLAGDESIPSSAYGKSPSWWILAWAAAFVAAVIILRKPMASLTLNGLNQRRQSEASRFREIGRTAKNGDGIAVMSKTLQWLDSFPAGENPQRLDCFLRKYGDPGLAGLANRVGALQPESVSSADIRAFHRNLARARRRWLTHCSTRRQRKTAEAALPELNKFPLADYHDPIE
jgi:hypothetical protein